MSLPRRFNHPKDACRVEYLIRAIRDYIRKRRPELRVDKVFDADLRDVLGELCSDGWAVGAQGHRQIAMDILMENTMVPGYKTLRQKLEGLAQAGVVRCLFARRGGRYLPLEVEVDRPLIEALRGEVGFKLIDGLASHYANTYLARLSLLPNVVQGFYGAEEPFGGERVLLRKPREEAPSGEPLPAEPPPTEPQAVESLRERITRVAAERTEKAQTKGQERLLKKQRADSFVAGASGVWQAARARDGFNEAPAWAGATADLTPAMRPMRSCLIKTFQQYGGLKAGLAWMAFCTGKPKKDSAGKLVFDPSIGYRQWSGPDKRPDLFAKHINSLLDEIQKLGWLTNQQAIDRVRHYFGDLVDVRPSEAPHA